MVDLLGLDLAALPDRDDPANWSALKGMFAEIFRSRTQQEWTELFDNTDTCVTAVLSLTEAPRHPHLAARATSQRAFGIVQPWSAPRFNATPTAIAGPPPLPGEHTSSILTAWGLSPAEVAELIESGAVDQA